MRAWNRECAAGARAWRGGAAEAGGAIGAADAAARSPGAADEAASSEDIRAWTCTATVPLAVRERGPSSVWLDMDGP